MKSTSVKGWTVILILLTMLFMPIIAVAAETSLKQYTISSLNMSISVPVDYLAISRDSKVSDPVWGDLGISWADGQKLLGDPVYFAAVIPSREYEIIVTASDSKVTNLSDLSASQIKELSDGFKTYYEQNGIIVDGVTQTEQSGVKYFKINGRLQRGDYSDHEIEYSTIRNKRAINVTIHFYSSRSEISSSDQKKLESLAQSVFRSISFSDKTLTLQETDSESIFSKALNKVLVAAFLGLVFGGFSLFRKKTKKDENDNRSPETYEQIIAKNIPSMNECADCAVKSALDTSSTQNGDCQHTADDSFLIHEKDDIAADSQETHFMVKTESGMSAWLPESKVGAFIDGQERVRQGERPPDAARKEEEILRLLKGMAAGSTNKQRSVETDSPKTASTVIEERDEQQPTAMYCRKCGAKLISGSNYCNKCGTKVNEPTGFSI